jgi:hypothetical protein
MSRSIHKEVEVTLAILRLLICDAGYFGLKSIVSRCRAAVVVEIMVSVLVPVPVLCG